MKIKSIILELLRYLIAGVLGISVLGIVAVNLLKDTLLNKQFVEERLTVANYYQKLHDYTYEQFTYYIYQSGFDKTILENIVSVEKITEDTNNIISNIYDGTENIIDTSSIKNKLEENVQNYLKEKNLRAEKSSLDDFSRVLIGVYSGVINHSNKIEKFLNNIISKVNNMVEKIRPIVINLTILIGVLLVLLCIRKWGKMIAMFGNSLLLSSFILISIDIFTRYNLSFDNLLFLNQPITDTIKVIVDSLLQKIIVPEKIFLVLGLVLIIIGNYIQTRLDRKNKVKLLGEGIKLLNAAKE